MNLNSELFSEKELPFLDKKIDKSVLVEMATSRIYKAKSNSCLSIHSSYRKLIVSKSKKSFNRQETPSSVKQRQQNIDYFSPSKKNICTKRNEMLSFTNKKPKFIKNQKQKSQFPEKKIRQTFFPSKANPKILK